MYGAFGAFESSFNDPRHSMYAIYNILYAGLYTLTPKPPLAVSRQSYGSPMCRVGRRSLRSGGSVFDEHPSQERTS